jgi:hypothetical protein
MKTRRFLEKKNRFKKKKQGKKRISCFLLLNQDWGILPSSHVAYLEQCSAQDRSSVNAY